MTSVRVDRYAAFAVNALGPAREPFPLSLAVTASEDAWSVDATAAQAREIVDVLAASAHDTAVVLDVEQTGWLADDHTPLPLGKIAHQQGVRDAVVHDIRWAAATRHSPGDLLVVPWGELARLLDGWSPYAIQILDAAEPPSGAQVEELALTVNTHDGGPLLPRLRFLPRARVYLAGHDDCYVHIETDDPDLPARLLRRLLALQAGAMLLDRGGNAVKVPEPPAEMVSSLLHRGDHWVGTVAYAIPGHRADVELRRTDGPWRPTDPLPCEDAPDVTLYLVAGEWRNAAP